MAFSENQIQEFTELIDNLYSCILLNDVPEDSSYIGYLDRDTSFGLDDNGYRTSYLDLLRCVFQIPNIAEKWSEDGVQELGHELLLDLANRKNSGDDPQEFSTIAQEWLSKIDIEFEDYVCYAIVSGLTVDAPINVGKVKFLPLDTNKPEFQDKLAQPLLEELNPYRDCISCSTVTAEWRRASQIHRQETEKSLNVVRFVGSLIWHDQPTRHVYIEGHDIKRVSRTLVVSSTGGVSSVGASEFTPHPIDLRKEMLPYADFNGFNEIKAMLNKPSPNELEQSFLTAVQWFGQATQEFLPLVAFIKYYISIEAVLKKDREPARRVLPRRLGVLIESWDRSRLDKLENDLLDFIDERNAVFHSGTPIASSPEELQWESRILSRQALHQLRQKLKTENWQTKDDLINWVDNHYQKYLS